MKEFNKVVIKNHEKIKMLFEKTFETEFSDMALHSIYFNPEGIVNDTLNYFKSLPKEEKEYFKQNPKRFEACIKELDNFVDTCDDLLKKIKGQSLKICSYDIHTKQFYIK